MSNPITVGIDPSTKASGYAVFSGPKLLFADKAPARTAAEVTRLVNWLIDMHVPDGSAVTVAIENSYCGVNVRTGLQLAELRGRISQECERREWGVVLVAPSQWRSTIFGKVGRRKRKEWKQAAVAMVRTKYDRDVGDDVAEAILIGAAYTNSAPSA